MRPHLVLYIVCTRPNKTLGRWPAKVYLYRISVVPARRDSSPQTRAVLVARQDHLARWRYDCDIARRTGLVSGTLYPILGRLADRGPAGDPLGG